MNILEMLKKGMDNINTLCAKYLNEENEIEYLPIFYIAGSQTLPPPLEPKEEEELIKKLTEEDNLQTRQILVERNLRLVVYIAKKFENTGIGIEDLISIGTIGLMKGVNTFNSDKNIKLATYASRCIENEILMLLRSKRRQAHEVSLYDPIGTDKEGNEINLLDIMESKDEDVVEKMALSGEVKRLYSYVEKSLSDREKQVICMRYGLYCQLPITQREIAKMMGISRSYVSRIEKKALQKLRKSMFFDD